MSYDQSFFGPLFIYMGLRNSIEFCQNTYPKIDSFCVKYHITLLYYLRKDKQN